MYSLLIKNASVVDGTGKKPYTADVAVQNDQIANIDDKIDVQAQTVVDAGGLTLAPGFIDLQNHSDSYWQIFDNPGLQSLTTQGFTTILIGNCGASLAPLLSNDALLSIQKWHSLDGSNINWRSFAEYAEQLGKQRFACNIASLVGYSTLRRGVVGDQVRSLEKGELEALKNTLLESLQAGAFGLSSGLSYAHEIIISELELFELAKILGKNNALFSVHLRSEGGELLEAVDEAIDIAKNAEANLKISHLKIRNEPNWAKFPELMSHLDTAYHKGANVHFDAYPYDTVWQPLYSYLPKWAMEGGRTMMLRHFADPVQKNKLLSHLNNSSANFRSMIVASTANKLNFSGKTIGQIAKNLETSSEQAVLHLIQNGGSEVLVFEQNLDKNQVSELVRHPLSFVGTDGAGFNKPEAGRLVHPRCFGTAPRAISMMLEGKLTLEQAVKKLTSGPAGKMGLKKRGEIKIGHYADLVLFDHKKLKDKATYENPYQFSEGIEYVFVNGKPVVAGGAVTEELPGTILKKS